MGMMEGGLAACSEAEVTGGRVGGGDTGVAQAGHACPTVHLKDFIFLSEVGSHCRILSKRQDIV